MKRHYGFVFGATLILFGCKSAGTNNKADNTKEIVVEKINEGNLIGSYVGAFGTNKITLLITKAINDSIEGRTVVGGNDQTFTGIIHQTAGVIDVIANEPGTDPHDGVFNFSFDNATPDVIKGSWKPNKETGNIVAKNYTLNRQSFKYIKNAGMYPQASTRLLKEDDVNNLVTEELEAMRNEIFARHGYCFKKKHLRAVFENETWYVPNTTDVKKDLTEIEKKNIALIKNFEKYAESYGDSFGR